jgi:hypothetical protein
MATTNLLSSRAKRYSRFRHSFAVSFTAGSSLLSRASTAGVLIVAARKLSTIGGLGVFATLFGIAVAASYVIASTTGNILAYWTRANPLVTGRLTRIVTAITVVCFAISLPLYVGSFGRGTIVTAAATVALLVSGVTSVVVMQTLRGLGRLSLAVTAGFLVPSIFRIVLSLILTGDVTVARMLSASALAASIGGLVGAAIVFLAPLVHDPDSDFVYRWTPSLSLAAGTVGIMWFALGQVDLTSLTIIRGSAVGGEYAPTMRAFEAMNALGLAVAFVSIRALAGASMTTAVDRIKRIIPPSLAVYAIITLPLLLVGHEVLTHVLHRHVFWSPVAVICLAIGYGGNLVMAVCFETLASQRATSRLFGIAAVILFISLAMTPAAVALFGIYGAAIGNSMSYLLGGIIVFSHLARTGNRDAPAIAPLVEA